MVSRRALAWLGIGEPDGGGWRSAWPAQGAAAPLVANVPLCRAAVSGALVSGALVSGTAVSCVPASGVPLSRMSPSFSLR
jgi:hypothetical protein